MTNSMKSPTWWKKRSTLERGLVAAAVSAVLAIAGLAITLGIITKETCVTPECLHTAAIEEQGLAPLHKLLKDLGGWPVLEGNTWNDNGFNWKELVYRFHKVGESVDYFMDFTVQVDAKNTTKHIIYVDEAFLGLPREYLTKGLSDRIVSAYYSYMVYIAVMLGADKERAAKELKESLEFEIKLANISLPIEKRSDFPTMYNPMTVRELTQWFPTIPWLDYFNTLLAPTTSVTEDELVIVNAPNFISELERLLKQVPKRVQANYVMWRAVANRVSELTDEIRKRQFAYYTVLYAVKLRMRTSLTAPPVSEMK